MAPTALGLSTDIMASSTDILADITEKDYEFGFVTDIEMDMAPVGLTEDTIYYISAKKNEPQWLLEWRLKAYKAFLKQSMPTWQNFEMPEIDFQKISYFCVTNKKCGSSSVGRASASQAEGREFESRFPLKISVSYSTR